MSDVVTAAPVKSFGKKRPKVAAFARYEGTSAWRKDRRRVKAFTLFKAKQVKQP